MLIYPILFLILLLIIGIKRIRVQNQTRENTFSVLIACRNEAPNLPALFHSFEHLNYPSSMHEIILVDDASSDKTLSLLQNFAQGKPNITVLHLAEKSPEYKGKKAALKAAAELAKFDFLAFTDADCSVPTNWLTNMNSYIGENTGAVIGYYLERMMNRITKVMKFLNAGFYAATTGLGYPMSACGGNLVVRKSVFEQIGGYDSFKDQLAGDDKMLLNLVRKTAWEVSYNPSEPVYTAPILNKEKRRNQKKRQYGKFYSFSLPYKLLVLTAFVFFLELPYLLIWKPHYFLIYFLSILFFWVVNTHKHRQKFDIIDVFLLVIIPYLMIYYGIASLLSGWKWKQ